MARTQKTTATRRTPPPAEPAHAPETALTKSALTPKGLQTQGEGLALSMAVAAKAEVEARYMLALVHSRDHDLVNSKLKLACQRSKFADKAVWRRPVGAGKIMEGFSIRFAEEALRLFGNVDARSFTLYEDKDSRAVRIQMTDLETNTSYAGQVTISKTVERKTLKKGQKAISERLNSYGERVFLVEATEADMLAKTNSQISKTIRTQGLRLVPADIKEDAWETLMETRKLDIARDPLAAKKKVLEGFMSINVDPKMLAEFLDQKIDTISPVQIEELRQIYQTIRAGATNWADISQAKAEERAAKKAKKTRKDGKTPTGDDKGSLNGLSPGDPAQHTAAGEPLSEKQEAATKALADAKTKAKANTKAARQPKADAKKNAKPGEQGTLL